MPKCRKCGKETALWSVFTDESAIADELFGSALCFDCLPPDYQKRVEDAKEKK